ncbi:Dps family protein [Mycetocola spongiae]|uniref:Dps family protein n=1 Tax=Mycetocola spongiae TaxID=2859226 RepID=UPI001CF5254B|nr:DNA starvation/stationary phase protection protein [Mycetocola spongiae]UCR89317.1 DNA starvation/stationary phase protection protein [Mycetocola spongiae]
MTKTNTVATSSVSADVAAGVAQFLSPVVLDLQALVINGKQAHWHVRGHNFIGIHELFDTVVANAQDWSDLAAERIIALGLPVDARLSTVAAKASNPELTAGFVQSDQSIAEVIAQIDAASASLRIAIDELGEIDPSSQDVAIEIARGLDKDRWFLVAHLSK